MTEKTKDHALWRYAEGGYGHTVTVYERKGRKNLYLSYWDADLQKKVPVCLGHSDRELAIQQCRDMSDSLRLDQAVQDGEARPDFALLFDRYHAAKGQFKRGTGPSEDLRRKEIWMGFFRAHGVSGPDELTQAHIDTFVRLRRHGDLRVEGVELREPAPMPPEGSRETRADVVAPGTVRADIVYLNTVLNWAANPELHAQPLISKNPIRVPQLKMRKPKRPVMNEDHHRDVLRHADAVDCQGLFGCFLRLLDLLGWRVTGLCYVRASDLLLTPGIGVPYGAVRKNPWVDKSNCDDLVPLTRHSRAVVLRLLKRLGLRAGEPHFLFPSIKDETRPWSRWHFRDLLERAEKAAKVEHLGGSHTWRRKWATERKGHPEVDVMRAGGWNDVESLRKCYSQADPETIYTVMSRPTMRLRRLRDPRRSRA